MKIKNILLISLLLLVVGCVEDENLVPSNPELGFDMPQGNHDYDDRIMEYYDKFGGSCILYRYEEKEAYWTASYFYKSELNSLTQTYYPYGKVQNFYYFFYETPDTNYVNQHLDLLEETFFSLYKEEALKKYLPLKLLLTSTLTNVEAATRTKVISAKTIFDATTAQLLFAGCNAGIENMTLEDKENYCYDVNRMFLYDYLGERECYEVPLTFSEVTTYSSSIATDKPTLYKNGLLNSTARTSPRDDWMAFMDVILTTSYEDMIAYYPDTDWSNKGILCSDTSNGQKPKDSSGKIRKKYEAMIAFFKEEFGIDLTRFANKN